jgi:formyl-CoA transferase
MTLPLSGLLVVSIEQAVAAPQCTCRLADAGARVIKVERPEGDFARDYDHVVHGESTHFVWLNRGKQSVVLDLGRPEDKALLESMLSKADVFVQNLKPGAIAKLGFSFKRLREQYPRLICCAISGFGESGPYAQRKAYDLLIQAESGVASVTGGPEAPARVGVSIVDIAAGLNAYMSILEALIARGRSGQGAEISISMFDGMAEWMTVPLLHGEWGTPMKRIGLAHAAISPYGVFKTRTTANGACWRRRCWAMRRSAAIRASPPTRSASQTGPKPTASSRACSRATTRKRLRTCWRRPKSASAASTTGTCC